MQYLFEAELTLERQADMLREAATRRLARSVRRSTRRPVPREDGGES